MRAIPNHYRVPYRTYPFLFGGVTPGVAFAEFDMALDVDTSLYQNPGPPTTTSCLTVLMTEWDGAVQIPYTFIFQVAGSTLPPGMIRILFEYGFTAAQLLDVFAATLIANTGFVVDYTFGQTSMRVSQPNAGVDGQTQIIWSSEPLGALPGPVHPSGIQINNGFAPRPATPTGSPAVGTIAVIEPAFDSVTLAGLTIEIRQYVAIGSVPYESRFIHFVAVFTPDTPSNVNILIDEGMTAEQCAIALENAAFGLGFEVVTLSPLSFSFQQPNFGPGGEVFLILSGTDTGRAQITFQGDALPGAGVQRSVDTMLGGVGSNLFLAGIPTGGVGLYGGNTIPIRWGMNYGIIPLAPPPTQE